MRVEVERLPRSQVQLQIEIDPEMLGQAVDKAYQRLAGRYKVPGFRPGKVPRPVLERAIGPEVLLSEAADICMNDAYAKAIKDHDLKPLGHPDVESPKAEEIKPDQPLSFTATVYVRPRAQLGDYRSLRIAPQVPAITQEQVDQVLKGYQEQQAPWEPVEDRAAEPGDLATLRIIATVEDETLVDQDSWEFRLSAEEAPNLPIPGLSDQIAGMRTGESKDVTIQLGEAYSPAEYAGKQMSLHLELLRLDQKILPELDDQFARAFGAFESMDQLRQALKTSLQTRLHQEAQDEYVDNVVRQVVAQAAVEAPPPLIDDQVDEMMRQLEENVERERRISMDTYTRVVGKSIEDLRAETRPLAEQRVRTNLVLDAVAAAEDVEVPSSEIDAEVRQVASSPTLSNKERRRVLASDTLRERVAERLRRRYVINKLLEITRPPEAAGDGDTVGEGGSEPQAHAAEVAATVPASTEGTQASSGPAELAGTRDNPSDQHNEQEN